MRLSTLSAKVWPPGEMNSRTPGECGVESYLRGWRVGGGVASRGGESEAVWAGRELEDRCLYIEMRLNVLGISLEFSNFILFPNVSLRRLSWSSKQNTYR